MMLAPKTPQRGRPKKEQKREVGRRYFIATEGLSEILYMKGIKDMLKVQKGPVVSVELTVLEREKSIKNMSDPKFNVTYLRDYVRAVTMTEGDSGSEITGALFVASALTGLIIDREPTLTFATDSEEPRKLFNEATKAVEGSDACNSKRRIVDYDRAAEVLREYLSGKNVAEEYLRDFRYPKYDQLFIEDRDRLCLIVDRDYSKKRDGQDYDARDEEYYSELRRLCRKDPDNADELRKIDLYVTTPSIEFWFLLHFDEFMDREGAYTDDELFTNKKNTDRKNLAEVLLDKIYREKFGIGYNKKDIQFEKCLRKGIGKAVENVQCYSETLPALEKHVGSNIRYLLEDLCLNLKEDSVHETIRFVRKIR